VKTPVNGGAVQTENTVADQPAAGLSEPSDRTRLRSALLRVVSFAREWHAQPGHSIDTLPEAVGAELCFQALPAPTSILGLSIKIGESPPLIVLNEELIDRPSYKAATICHEAFHVKAGFDGIMARCDAKWHNDPMERLAWLGPAIFMVPEEVVHDAVADGFRTLYAAIRHSVHPTLAAQRLAIAVVEGTAPGDPHRAMSFLDASAFALCSWTLMLDGLVPPSTDTFDMWPYTSLQALAPAPYDDRPARVLGLRGS
jgi:hypothetical protein